MEIKSEVIQGAG